MATKIISSLALAAGLSVLAGGCASPTVKPPTQQSFGDKLGASIKSGTSKLAAAVTPKKDPAEAATEPLSKPGPKVFVAAAQMHERSNKFDEAEANYRKALELDSKYLPALIGYARLEDRRSNFEAATRIYQRAIKAHPRDATVHNDLGLCYHRRGMMNDATRELKRAVELDKENKLYRNNLAAAHVEQGQTKEALVQLSAAHGKSVGHYNLGYLLMQKGDRAAALRHFQLAAQSDPNLTAAQQWVAKLSAPVAPYTAHGGGTAVAQSPQGGYYPSAQAGGAYVAQRPPYQAQYAPQQPPPTAYAVPQVQQGYQEPAPPVPSRY